MKRSSHYGKLIPLIVLVSLIFAALTPTAAFAEGDIPEAPPAEAPPAEAEQPEEDVPAAVREHLGKTRTTGRAHIAHHRRKRIRFPRILAAQCVRREDRNARS